jgi:hypothetical protein
MANFRSNRAREARLFFGVPKGNDLRCGKAAGVLVVVHDFLGSARAREKLFSGIIARARDAFNIFRELRAREKLNFKRTARARGRVFTKWQGR